MKPRELEMLVARIERTLAPRGAIVKSPDRLVDKVTGQLREVDVSIRSDVGSAEILIIIECRKRAKTEDVTWIEQLATKQKHIGADRVIAVSSKKFSAPALRAAQAHGISTRTVSEVTDAEISKWANSLEVNIVSTNFIIGSMTLMHEAIHSSPPVLDEHSQQEWSARTWDAAIFRDKVTGTMVTIIDLVVRILKESATESPGLDQ